MSKKGLEKESPLTPAPETIRSIHTVWKRRRKKIMRKKRRVRKRKRGKKMQRGKKIN